MNSEEIKQAVREMYGKAALDARGGKTTCCGTSGGCGADVITADLYDKSETEVIPAEPS